MLGDASEIEQGSTLMCDVCIIGGGPAGITVALELARSQFDVVLLESGGLEPSPATEDLNVGELQGAPQYPTSVSRLRMLGGSTGHWGGMCRPLDPADFEMRAWVPHSGWPMSRSELDEYYPRAHEVCELGPYDYSSTKWPELLKPEPGLTRMDSELLLLQLSPPTRFGQRYRPDLEQAKTVRVLLHATVTQIVPEPRGRTVEHIDVQQLSGHGFHVRARRYVLACGGIENARLLLLSNRIVPAGLGNDHDWVGRCFMDHPAAVPLGTFQLLRSEARRLVQNQPRPEGAPRPVKVGLGLGIETQRSHGLLNSVLFVGPPGHTATAGEASPQRTLAPVDTISLDFLQRVAGGGRAVQTATCWIRSEQAPNPESRITLSDAVDGLGQRRVRLEWRLTNLDYDSFSRSARQYARALGAAELGRIEIEPWLLQRQPDWWSNIEAGWHHMGTTRMAGEPPNGVVDSACRVFALDNLFVAGSSVFPTSGFANPTLTIVALALRLAKYLGHRG
jgi:choline dehydrogenase-like flavoprotein